MEDEPEEEADGLVMAAVGDGDPLNAEEVVDDDQEMEYEEDVDGAGARVLHASDYSDGDEEGEADGGNQQPDHESDPEQSNDEAEELEFRALDDMVDSDDNEQEDDEDEDQQMGAVANELQPLLREINNRHLNVIDIIEEQQEVLDNIADIRELADVRRMRARLDLLAEDVQAMANWMNLINEGEVEGVPEGGLLQERFRLVSSSLRRGGEGEEERFDIDLPGQHLYLRDVDHGEENQEIVERSYPQVDVPLASFEASRSDGGTSGASTSSAGDAPLNCQNFDYEKQEWVSKNSYDPHLPKIQRFPKLENIPVLTNTAIPNQKISIMLGATIPLQVTSPVGKMTIEAVHRTKYKWLVCVDPTHPATTPGCVLSLLSSVGIGDMYRLKAKAVRRFRVAEISRDVTGVYFASIYLLPEVVIESPYRNIQVSSMERYSVPPITEKPSESYLRRKRIFRRCNSVLLSQAPHAFDAIDTAQVARKLRTFVINTVITSNTSQDTAKIVPEDPAELSAYAAINLPLTDADRHKIMTMNSINHRLCYLLHFVTNDSKQQLLCHCSRSISSVDKTITVSRDGSTASYVNPGGYIHEMITVSSVDTRNINLTGLPTTRHSWFEGYAWTIIGCRHCRAHLGWKFTVANMRLKPSQFYGLVRSAVIPVNAERN